MFNRLLSIAWRRRIGPMWGAVGISPSDYYCIHLCLMIISCCMQRAREVYLQLVARIICNSPTCYCVLNVCYDGVWSIDTNVKSGPYARKQERYLSPFSWIRVEKDSANGVPERLASVMLVEHNMSKADDIVLAPFVFSKKAILFSCPDASQDRLGKLIDYPVLQTRLFPLLRTQVLLILHMNSRVWYRGLIQSCMQFLQVQAREQ